MTNFFLRKQFTAFSIRFFILKPRKVDLGFFCIGTKYNQLKVIFQGKIHFSETLSLLSPQQVFFRVSTKLLGYVR